MADTSGKRSSSSIDDAEKRDLMKKLTIWQSQALSPMTTHEELEPILAELGFVWGPLLPPPPPHGAVQWRSYTYMANSRWMKKLESEQQPPTVKLPHPRFDGLHHLTYTTFFNALNFYLERDENISFTLHVRRMDVTVDELDQETSWKIEDSVEDRYMYKATLLDSETIDLMINKVFDDNAENEVDALLQWRTRRTRGSNSSSTTCVVPLRDIITSLPPDDDE